MELQHYSLNDVIVLRLNGRVDSNSIPVLRERIDVITTNKPSRIIVDLAKVSFMDSSGLATLVYAMKHCREGGGNLCLINPAQPIRMILELTRLDKALDIFGSTADAVASFRSN